MQLKFVELFCDIAARRSFSKGAAAHQVSQSSASQAVSLLEKRLGTQLIDRSQRPFELTPAGKIYFEGCRELLAQFRSLEDQVRRAEDRVAGTVRVAAIYSVGLMQMEQSVSRFEELYPEARLRLEYLHPDQVYEQLLNDEADLGLVSFPQNGGEFSHQPWQQQPMVLVLPPGHRLADRSPVFPDDLEGEDFVAFTEELTIRKEVDRWFRKSRVTINIGHEFDNIESIKSAVEVGSGITLLPEPTVRREVAKGVLVAIPVKGEPLYRPLGIVQRRQKPLSTAAQKWIELLQQEAAAGSVQDAPVSHGNGSDGVSSNGVSAGLRAEVGATRTLAPKRQKKRV